MLPFPLFLALTYLKPKRSFASIIPVITVVGVMLGVAILMIVLAVMTGFGDAWREKILSFKPHMTIRPGYRNAYIEEPDAVCNAISGVSGVTACSPVIITPVMVRFRDNDPPVTATVIGIDPERISVLSNIETNLIAGSCNITENNILLGRDLTSRLRAFVRAEILCYSPLNLNASEELYFPEEMIVAGIYDMGMRDFDDGIIIASLGVTRDIVGIDDGAHAIQVQVDTPEKARELSGNVTEALETSFPNERFYVTTWESEDSTLFNALRMEKTMMFILLAFIAIVAAFCVTSTLIVITIQKTNEIGLLKALGFPPAQLLFAFVLNGLIHCVMGIALGLGAGYLVLRNLVGIVSFLGDLGLEVFSKEIYGLSEIPWRIVPSDVIAVVSVVFVFCLIASFLPAWRAASMNPVKAINQE